jgi:ATP-binding cassette, subfamily B, bacterial PglK
MLTNIKDLYYLLSREQRKRLLRLQVLILIMAMGEVAGVISIGPFMALVGDMSRLEGDGLLAQLYQLTGFSEPSDFLFWMGVAVLGALTLAALMSMFTIWRLSMYAHQLGAELSIRLYNHYMQQPWLYHANGSSTVLTNRIFQECRRVTESIITPILHINAKLVMTALMATTIFLFNPIVAVVGVGVFIAAYLLLYRTVRRRLSANGAAISRTQSERFKLMMEGFGGIKDVLLLGRQDVFKERFEKISRRYGRAKGINKALAQVPRYAMELVAFGAVIFLVLYLLRAHQGNLGTILPILSVYALAGLKLLPAFQMIYSNISTIRGNMAGFENLREDLYASRYTEDSDSQPSDQAGKLVLKEKIELCDVVFRYPNKARPALDTVSLTMPARSVIGLVGSSGSGKSTLIDILLGLIDPESGKLLVDGQPLSEGKMRAWQNSIGFVPQAIFLADASIRENIAFGLPREKIDLQRVERAARMANLDEFLVQLPDGLDTRVGERGIQLSGGQRQRIGIARALYDDAEVLIFDEATSALDGITEKLVMEAIHDFSGKKTIIMIAHRLATVKRCDCIYLMEDGRIIDAGCYNDLVNRNGLFKEMANLS